MSQEEEKPINPDGSEKDPYDEAEERMIGIGFFFLGLWQHFMGLGFHKKLGHFIGMLTLAALIFYTAYTIKIYKSSTEANGLARQSLEAVQRAFITFKEIQYERMTMPDLKTHNWEFQAMFENSGTTPAVHAITHFDSRIFASGQPEPPEPGDAEFKGIQKKFSYMSIGPRTTQTVGRRSHPETGIFDKDLGDFQSGITPNTLFYKDNFTFWGWVQYRDKFFPRTPTHITEFCVRLVSAGLVTPVGGQQQVVSFKFASCENHNCSDEDCKDYSDIAKIVPE